MRFFSVSVIFCALAGWAAGKNTDAHITTNAVADDLDRIPFPCTPTQLQPWLVCPPPPPPNWVTRPRPPAPPAPPQPIISLPCYPVHHVKLTFSPLPDSTPITLNILQLLFKP